MASKLARTLNRAAIHGGIDLRRASRATRGVARFVADLRRFKSLMPSSRSAGDFTWGSLFPITTDRFDSSGSASGHYFHQDLFTAQQIYLRNPERHIDIGSRIDGFVAHVATFREIEVVDIRPLNTDVRNIKFLQGDISRLEPESLGRADSVSCLHALEHIGLGRYGDTVDPDGFIAALDNIVSLVRPGGTLYLSVPMGSRQRIEFNAHRVFSIPYMRSLLQSRFEQLALAIVDDQGDFHRHVSPTSPQAEDSFGTTYGCAIWTCTNPVPRPSWGKGGA